MRMSWKLGRVSGIDVYVHPTFLFVLALPAVGEGGAFGLSLILAAFFCVLLHEFGHALTARRFGIGTQDITLYPIGGVARLTGIPRSPKAELLIALAGPAVNMAIAALLVGLGVLGFWSAPLVGPFLVNLLALNLVLALFNLVPAFPMDGGRVLRALLSGWIGRVRATFVAAGIGRLLAMGFGLFSLVHGMWFQVALSAFIYWAAGAELRSVLADESRRRFDRFDDDGVWAAPPGYRWVSRGQGRWQLAPITVHTHDRTAGPWR